MSKYPEIHTERGSIVTNENNKAQLVWNTNFQSRYQQKFMAAQVFVDSEVLRLSEPYIPLLTGMLIMSGILGTYVGTGEVSWIAPYARPQYYSKRKPGSTTGPLRGPFWFERMKEVSGQRILEGARKIYARTR